MNRQCFREASYCDVIVQPNSYVFTCPAATKHLHVGGAAAEEGPNKKKTWQFVRVSHVGQREEEEKPANE